MRKLTTLICCFLFFSFGFSQNEELETLTIQLAFEDPDTTKVNTSINIIKILYDINDYDRALKYIRNSEKLSNDLNYKKGIAEITYYKALIFSKKEDYINAVDNYSKSKIIYQQLKDTLGVAKINKNIGLIEIERGNYDKGLEFSVAAISELEKRGLKSELTDAYRSLAMAYQSMEVYDKAIEFNLKTLELQEEFNDNEGLIITNKKLGDLYYRDNDYGKAINYYKDVLLIIGDDDNVTKGEVLTRLGQQYLKLKNYEDAKDYLTQGLRLNRRVKNDEGVLISLNDLGKIYIDERKPIVAERLLYEATTIGRKVENDPELAKNYKLRAKLDSLEGNYKLAFNWQRRHYELKDEIDKRALLNSKKNSVNINPPTTSTIEPKDSTQTEALTTKFEEEQKANLEEIDRLKLIFYALLAALAVVSTILVLIYLKRSNSIKYAKALEEKNKKIEIQNEEILGQSKHLENINQVKDRLFSIVSHDLKDSLTSIKGFIDLLKDGSLSQDEFNHLIPELSENANNASLLLFNLLNWSKSQMQSLESNPSLFDVQEVFAEKLKLIEQKTEKKGIQIQDQSLRDFIYADRSMVEIIIQNLLTNAVKFCKSGDTITISNHISNGNSVISIGDTGVGISKENQEQLFKNNSFTTIGTKNEKGTGLGLTICKELVELNHGKIWVESTENIGSTFYVELPKSNPKN